MTRIAILGAGLTGLSAAYHLGGGYDIFERDVQVGGLCRTMERDGFLFDYTGHLLHLRQDSTTRLIQELLPDRYIQHSRKSRIFSQGRLVNYPFQANIYGLPPEVIKECIIGFVETLTSDRRLPAGASASRDAGVPRSFQDWVLDTFGAGVAKYFMFPYNQKLWRTPLDQLSADWVSWAIPKPTLDEFLNGALGIQNREFGYNPTFLYPKNGGVSQLPEAFARHLNAGSLLMGKTAVEIDAGEQTIHFADGSCFQYDTLISTLPLQQFMSLLKSVPGTVREAAGTLRAISVYDVNIGVKRPNISDAHWMYFPEPDYPFYRVGFPTNFSETVAPPGCSSMYVEVSALPHERIPKQELLESVYAGLRKSGILRENDEILVEDVVRIECAYVIYDLNRKQALETILPFLASQRIHSVGRYGAWEYSSMEDAILAGKKTAENLKGM